MPEQTPNASLKQLMVSGGWALRLILRTCPGTTAGLIVLTLLRSAVPVGLALAGRGLINSAVEVASQHRVDLAPLAPWLVIGFVLTVIEAVGELATALLRQRLQDDVNLAVTSSILEHAAELDVSFFEDRTTREMMERARQTSASRFSMFFSHSQQAITAVLQAAALVALLVALEPLSALVMAPFAVPLLLSHWRLARERYATEHARVTKRRWMQYHLGKLTSSESVGEVRTLGLASVLIDRFRTVARQFRDEDRRLHGRRFRLRAIFAALTTAAFYLVFIRVSLRVLEGSLTFGDLAIFGGAAVRLRGMFDSAIEAGTSALEQSMYIADVQAFFSARPSLKQTTGLRPPPGDGALRIENLTFRYPGRSEPALRDVSLKVAAGESVAIVGENGAGKSTLVKLIARLYDPDAGQIWLDGIPLQELALDHLHGQIAYLGQGFGRYEATAAENIAFGDWPRLLDQRERIEQIARLAKVDAMIEAMPEGYDTRLGCLFGEYDPSGGQWQGQVS